MSKRSERLEWLLSLDPPDRKAYLRRLRDSGKRALRHHWRLWAAEPQLPPEGDWLCWMIMAGRGFGKTRAGAEWVRDVASHDPAARIALVGATLGEARAVMVEGESGLLAISPRGQRPKFEPSLRRLVWPNGAQATLYSAGECESLRGPQHSHAWCDEIGKWDDGNGQAQRSWDNLMFGLRLGEQPRVLATTTPRAVALVRRLRNEAGNSLDTVLTTGRSDDNAENLPERFLREIRRKYGRSPDSRKRKASSTKASRASTPWSILQSKPNWPVRRPAPPTARRGWSPAVPAGTGPGNRVNSPRARQATGCSLPRATASRCSIARPVKRCVMPAPGK